MGHSFPFQEIILNRRDSVPRGTSRANTSNFTSRVRLFHPLFHPLPDFSDDVLLDVNLFCGTMAPKFKDGEVVLAFSGAWVSWAHTIVAYSPY